MLNIEDDFLAGMFDEQDFKSGGEICVFVVL